MRTSALAIALAVAIAAASPAAAERLVFALSSHRVLINSSFAGAELVLFGTVEPNGTVRQNPSYDIVVAVTGPRQDVVTRQKERVLAIWVNVDSRTFIDTPAYLAVLTNREIDAIASQETLRRQQIGIDNTVISGDSGGIVNNDPFRAAFLRLNRQHGLYREDHKGVTFLTPNLFRAGIQLPASSPIGIYRVEVKLFLDGKLLASQDSALEIVKVGFEQFVAGAARDHGFLYGLATVTLAIMTGWLAAVVFRRD
ncbi:MAG: TIGR02186 family protein [Xanthobacteraceae bacterium]|jgi:uncharacterized protein (TIGR02186 family)